jgi:hypothetical protein
MIGCRDNCVNVSDLFAHKRVSNSKRSNETDLRFEKQEDSKISKSWGIQTWKSKKPHSG